jgi:hypothetical protein
MEINEVWKSEFLALYPGAVFHSEAGYNYIYVKNLHLPEGCEPAFVSALLCISPRDGYDSRLYVSKQIQCGTNRNWNSNIYVMDGNWCAISWRTEGDLSYTEMLLVHLNAFKNG